MPVSQMPLGLVEPSLDTGVALGSLNQLPLALVLCHPVPSTGTQDAIFYPDPWTKGWMASGTYLQVHILA